MNIWWLFFDKTQLAGIFAAYSLLHDSSFGKSTLELEMDHGPEIALAAAMISDPLSGPTSAPGDISGLWRKHTTVVSM